MNEPLEIFYYLLIIILFFPWFWFILITYAVYKTIKRLKNEV